MGDQLTDCHTETAYGNPVEGGVLAKLGKLLLPGPGEGSANFGSALHLRAGHWVDGRLMAQHNTAVLC
jgi:hypothetical protein